MSKGKIVLLEEHCWVIRGKSTKDGRWLFHVVANEWNGSPAHATIYHSEENAIRFIEDMRHYDRVSFGKDDIVEAVPLNGALRTLGTEIRIDPNGMG
jgi:hypothetical protein